MRFVLKPTQKISLHIYGIYFARLAHCARERKGVVAASCAEISDRSARLNIKGIDVAPGMREACNLH